MGEADIKHIKRVNWPEISSKVASVNHEVWTVLDQIMSEASEQDRPKPLIVAEYPYGQLLVDKGHFCLPCEPQHALCPECETIAPTIKYSPIPLGLVLDKSVEIFIELDAASTNRKRLVPLRVLSPGELFGVFETLDMLSEHSEPAKPLFSVSSGARSVVIVAPLNAARLRQTVESTLDCRLPPGTDYFDWQFIQCVTQAASSDQDWRVQVLIFPDWLKESESLARLPNLLYKTGWHQMAPLRHYAIEEATMAGLYMSQGANAVATNKGEFYYYSTWRHILSIAKGDMLAFAPVTTQSQVGPFFAFQNIMSQEAMGMSYYPVLLQPHRLTEPDDIGYYSVNRPSLLAPVPQKLPQKTLKAFIQQIYNVLSRLSEAREQAKLNWEKTTFYSANGSSSSRQQIRDIQLLEPTEFLPTSISASSKTTSLVKVYLGSDFFQGVVRIVRK